MIIMNQSGNLKYDSEHKKCSIEVVSGQDGLYAFLTCLDIGLDGSLEIQNRYWGRFSWDCEEDSILNILHNGGSWPHLVKVETYK